MKQELKVGLVIPATGNECACENCGIPPTQKLLGENQVECYMQYKATELIGKELIDIIPNTEFGKRQEMAVLSQWINHFRKLKSPFIIIKKGKKLSLWKECKTPGDCPAIQLNITKILGLNK